MTATFIRVIRRAYPFFAAVFFSVVSIPLAQAFFSTAQHLASAAFIAVGLSPVLKAALDENRDNIWQGHTTSLQANVTTVKQFTAIFLGVFAASLLSDWFFAASAVGKMAQGERQFQNTVWDLLMHNGSVLLMSFLLTLVYRAGGLVIILAWNALHWSDGLRLYFSAQLSGDIAEVGYAVLVLPHLLLEVVAYVSAGLGGSFLSIGACKYAWHSAEFMRVARAVLLLCLIALALLGLSCVLEVHLFQAFSGNAG